MNFIMNFIRSSKMLAECVLANFFEFFRPYAAGTGDICGNLNSQVICHLRRALSSHMKVFGYWAADTWI